MLPPILEQVKAKGFKVFTAGKWNINIVGVRSPSRKSNVFDDFIHVVFKDHSNSFVDLVFQITTDPGLYWLKNPSRVDGTAILVGNKQYRGVWKIDKHQGKYDALCQRNGKVTVYRDRNKDSILDMDSTSISEGYYGINIHRSSLHGSTEVNRYSAGCQVFADPNDFSCFMSLCKKSAKLYGNSFSYTLLEG